MVSIQKLGLLLSLVSTSVFAQEGLTTGPVPGARRNVLTVSVPLQGLDSQVSLEGEHVLGDRFSVGLGVIASFSHAERRMDPRQYAGLEGENLTNSTLGLAPAVRFYLTGTAPQGLWVSPRLEAGYGWSTAKYTGNRLMAALNERDADTWFLGAAAVVGYSMVLEPGFTLQGGVGLATRREAVSFSQVMQDSDGLYYRGEANQSAWTFTERFMLNAGWAF
ncbi:hypothetical protein D7Y13_27150 [Corallococcus praedator]|uniref:Outer membrane protein beta-barrel domain-containing protein n=1 Tax=Corallococcus praedator TaxID=2316724 RepID=A0ABX9QBF2_9BACT|nr:MULTISPECIES: hypothetical protein [Corallococcus]RKH34803.1 hypothetical protein D7X75_07000 [Corallococcus sp. CA031C]RKH99888.1 hypothetical protein D7Y13_27150 [Corallococcus praedator]